MLLESRKVGALGATHAIDHGQRDFHGRGRGLRVAAEDIAEVDVEKVAYASLVNASFSESLPASSTYHRVRAIDCPSADHRRQEDT